MVGVEHHDDVRPRRRKLLLLRAEQLGDLAIGAVALDENGKTGVCGTPNPATICAMLANSCLAVHFARGRLWQY